MDEEGIVGYCGIIFGDELAYHEIEDAWKTERPYAVLHRLAFSNRAGGRGLSKEAFDLIKELCLSRQIDAIRADTQGENKLMQHVLEREGFSYCGLIQFGGGPKLAYEWVKTGLAEIFGEFCCILPNSMLYWEKQYYSPHPLT